MYSKNFVSISFSSKRVSFLQLNASKKQVLKFGSIEIPEGLIINYKVSDTAALAKLIKDACKKFGLKEKSVGLIVPEFSTYTRTLVLPQIGSHELDEAVRWQMQEFLPDGGVDTVMDWKILKSVGNQYHVLAVAIPKQVLSSYVEAVSEAGLMPLAVETPSLSLVRVAASEEVKILIYGNAGEAILIVAAGQQIIGTVVAPSADQDALSKLALQISKHYAHTPPVKIVLAGMEISENLVAKITDELKLPVEWIKQTVEGLTASQIQEYIIPISLQFKDPTEPSDAMSVNLLPPHWADTYRDIRLKLQVWSLVLISTMVIWSCLLTIVGANLVLANQVNSLKNGQTGAGEASPELVAEVTNINKVAGNAVKIKESSKAPEELINSIVSAKPVGVTISKIEINLEEGRVAVLGQSTDRTNLVQLKQALDAKEEFGPVGIPISTLELESNIPFNIEFAYLQALPKAGGQVKLKL